MPLVLTSLIRQNKEALSLSFDFFEGMDLNSIVNQSNASIPPVDETQAPSVIPSIIVQFWTILVLEVLSLACTLFLLYHLLLSRRLRLGMHNHIIIILLVLTLGIEIFDNPLYIDAYRLGKTRNSFTLVPSICLMWWFFDYGVYGSINVFLALGSFSRHILVFHQRQLLRTARQRFFIHYLPLIILSLYLSGFYVGVIVFPPCENTFDLESLGCGLTPCYSGVSYLNLWDFMFNGITCTFIEATCSLGLLVRVFWQKHRAHQPMNWRKHRKMAVQLLSVSCLSLSMSFPLSLINVVRQVGGPGLAYFAVELNTCIAYLSAVVILLLPFVCLAGLPELWPKVWFLNRKRQRTINNLTLLADGRQTTLVLPRIG